MPSRFTAYCCLGVRLRFSQTKLLSAASLPSISSCFSSGSTLERAAAAARGLGTSRGLA